MDAEECINKLNQQLKDENFHKKNEDPARKHDGTANIIIESFKKQELLSTSTAKKLTKNEVRTPQFFILPKNK